MTAVLRDPDFAAVRAREARDLVATRFDWDHAVDRLEAIYGLRPRAGGMIQAQPVSSPALRIAVLCPGFAADRIRRQPWHVADGLARGLAALGHDVRLFTDALGPRPAAPYPVETLELLSGGSPAPELRSALAAEPVDRVFLVTGAARWRASADWRSAHRSRW